MDSQRIKDEGYFGAFADAYELFKEIDDDSLYSIDYWGGLNRKANNITRKYAGTQAESIARKLVVAVLDEAERLYTKGKVIG